MTTRRKYLTKLGLLCSASGALVLGTGAQTSLQAARSSDVDVEGDASAFVGIDRAHSPKVVWANGADTVNDLVTVTNNLTETADVTFTDLTASGSDVELHDGSGEVGNTSTVSDVGAGGATSINATVPESESIPHTPLAFELRLDASATTITVDRSVTIEDRLLGYYPMEDGTAIGNGTTPDRSGYGNDGTIENSENSQQTGRIGSSLRLDGYDDYVDVSGLAGNFADQSFTVAMWYRPNALSGTEDRGVFGVHGSSSEYFAVEVRTDGSVGAEYGGGTVATASSLVTEDTWHHVAVRYDADADATDVYVDGIAEGSGSAGPFTGSSPSVVVGLRSPNDTGGTGSMDGRFDDVRVYGRPLSGAEIEDLYDLDFTDNTGGGGGGGTDATAPTAPSNLASPSHGGTYVDLDWDPSSDDGGSGLDHYNVYVDGTEDHQVAAGTTSTTVDALSTNATYDFYVTAVDGAGNESSASDTVTVTTDDQAPYDRSSPWPIPGLVEAEDFDVGGQNVAYYDTTAGEEDGTHEYRSTDVDIVDDDQGDYAVGYIQDGEWLEYTVSVESSGYYELDARVASGNAGGGGPFHVEMDGTDVTGSISVPDTDGYDSYEIVTASEVRLDAGDHTMRVAMDGDAFNLDHLDWNHLLYDTCDDLNQLHSSSDTGSLTVNTVDTASFEKPDGTTDGYRVNRDGTTADTAMIYAPGGTITDLYVEFHWWDEDGDGTHDEGGDVTYYESTDGGSTWSQIAVNRTAYGSYDTDDWRHRKHTHSSFSAGADRVKMVLTGGTEDWSPQVGEVKISYE